jgi:hypothetical protein
MITPLDIILGGLVFVVVFAITLPSVLWLLEKIFDK